MSARDDGGPAFPVQDAAAWQAHGMTLRDFFAAKAMAAAVSHHGVYDEEQTDGDGRTSATCCGYHSDSMARIAYVYADAMLKERAK